MTTSGVPSRRDCTSERTDVQEEAQATQSIIQIHYRADDHTFDCADHHFDISRCIDRIIWYGNAEDIKALGNEHRLQMLEWLKAPQAHFPPHHEVEGFGDGVCVAFIQQKVGLSQSTTSHYLAILEDAGLVIPTRIGKWIYYKRNEAAIAAFREAVQQNL
jgi:DNA-binding transcriptional ArsR family regulator